MPKISVLVGMPNSGKSTWCKQFPEKDVISRDAIIFVFWGNEYVYSNRNEQRVTAIFNELFKSSVQEKKDILLDNTHCKEKYINEFYNNVPEGYEVEVIFFDIPLWKAHVRNVWRYFWKGKWIPLDVMGNMYENYNKIDKSKYK